MSSSFLLNRSTIGKHRSAAGMVLHASLLALVPVAAWFLLNPWNSARNDRAEAAPAVLADDPTRQTFLFSDLRAFRELSRASEEAEQRKAQRRSEPGLPQRTVSERFNLWERWDPAEPSRNAYRLEPFPY